MNDVNKNLISATRICTSVYLIMTFGSDSKSQVSYSIYCFLVCVNTPLKENKATVSIMI